MRKVFLFFVLIIVLFLYCEIDGGNNMAPNAKPDKLPEFASTDVVDGVTGQNNVVEPPEAKKDSGWNFLEKPSRNWMNWIHRKSWQWLVYFNQFFSSTHQFKINEIVEFDTDSGVTIDGSLIKDGDIKVDAVTENTLNAGVTVDDVLVKDGDIKVDTITEKTTDAGVIVDGTTIKDGVLIDDGSEGIGIEETNGEILRTKIIEIGDWNMDATVSVAIAHGLTFSKIINFIATIIADANNLKSRLDRDSGVGADGYIDINTTNVNLYRRTGGVYDDTSYDSTSFNRGYITIQYID